MAYVHFIKLFQIGCSLIKHLKIDSNQVKANHFEKKVHVRMC